MAIKLIHGDCLGKLKSIPDKSIDMVLCDPPYGTTACKWDVIIPFEPMWNELKRVIKDNGAICLFGSEPFSSHLRLSNLKMYKYDWVWDKVRGVGHLNAKKRPMMCTELISVFNGGSYFPQMRPRDKARTSKNRATQEVFGKTKDNFNGETLAEKYPLNLVQFQKSSQKDMLLHPTQKPVVLLEYLIKTYTLENETVLDFTMGSGSTGVACKNLKRNFIGIEKDRNYFKIAVERIKNA